LKAQKNALKCVWNKWNKKSTNTY